jgi:hypothetical protein
VLCSANACSLAARHQWYEEALAVVTTTATQGTFQALRTAIEGRDADAILELIADDAVMVNYDRRQPLSQPITLEGKVEIAPILHDVYGRDMTHEVRDEVVGDDRISFNEWCQYPDGLRVIASNFFDVRDGKVMRACVNQNWDE